MTAPVPSARNSRANWQQRFDLTKPTYPPVLWLQDVTPRSPAANAGLISNTDYIIAADSALDDRDDLFALKGRDLLKRRRDLQMVFQDPYGYATREKSSPQRLHLE